MNHCQLTETAITEGFQQSYEYHFVCKIEKCEKMAILNINKSEGVFEKEQARVENFGQISFNSNALLGLVVNSLQVYQVTKVFGLTAQRTPLTEKNENGEFFEVTADMSDNILNFHFNLDHEHEIEVSFAIVLQNRFNPDECDFQSFVTDSNVPVVDNAR